MEIIRRSADSVAALGLQFEDLFSVVALNAPELEVKEIYRLSQWADAPKYRLSGRDIGVDRVAILNDGSVVAIQCKCYDENNTVGKNDIQKFMSGSQNDAFQQRWIVTTSALNDVARRMIEGTNVKHLDFFEFADCRIQGGEDAQREPWPLQQAAIDAVVEGFENPDNNARGQLIMACGSGKTFTALKIAERIVSPGGRILFLAPSIALVAQARKEWLRHTARPLRCAVVCSDQTVKNSESISLKEVSFDVTTDPQTIADALKQAPADGVAVIFCTYQSLERVGAAQQEHGAPAFDLALVDEAHRTAGAQDRSRATPLFQKVHSQAEINCKKRLYMTATPRVYDERAKDEAKAKDAQLQITDMNDAATFGPRFYRLPFREAVNAGMLCDVRVICLGLSEDMMHEDLVDKLRSLSAATPGQGAPPDTAEYLATLVIGLALNGLVESKRVGEAPDKLPKTLAYANTTRRSRWLAEALKSEDVKQFVDDYRRGRAPAAKRQDKETLAIEAEHLDGADSAHKRNRAIHNLNAEDERTARVITNCRLFAEGVDVPNLSSVAFMDPRSSATDIIQAIGRVMRKGAGDKKFGYIIAPFALEPGESVTAALGRRSHGFKILGRVLRALQSHDEELTSKLSEMVIIDAPRADDDADAPDGEAAKIAADQDITPDLARQLGLDDPDAIYAQIAKYSGLGDTGKQVANIIIDAVKRAARVFIQEKAALTLAETLGQSPEFIESLPDKDRDDKLNEASHTAALIIGNACLMHKRLEASGNLDDLHPLEKMGSKAAVIDLLIKDWRAILSRDYKPIFEQALAILNNLKRAHPQAARLQDAIHNLINCAVDTSEPLNELGYDHAGPLYHTILENAASQGAFYTKNTAALLLGKLVFNDDLLDWSDPAQVAKLRVIDPCCGTGTLLMAGLNAIKSRAQAAQRLSKDEVVKLHKALVENCFFGLDITSQAVQLAACNMTLGAPDTSYTRMNMYSLEYGMARGASAPTRDNVRHGALELLKRLEFKQANGAGQGALDMRDIVAPINGVNVNGEAEELKLPAKFDVIMMNPPFTFTSRQGIQFPKSVGKAMNERLQQISDDLKSKSEDAHSALAKMSIGPFFTPLSDELIAKDRGTLAKIVPVTALTSNNGLAERIYIANRFHVETVITSHDPKNIAFSESSNIHEAIVIARRKADKRAPTRFVQLAQLPANTQQVERLARAIGSSELNGWGSCTMWPADKVQAGDWSPVQWYSPEIVEAISFINDLDGLAVSGERYSWNPGDVECRTHFTYKANEPSSKGETNLYQSVDITQHSRIASPPDTWATPKPDAKLKKRAEKLMSLGGHVLVSSRISTTSASLIAVYSDKPAIGSGFRPIDSASAIPADRAKAYAVFMNSTFGALQILNRRTRKMTYPRHETGHLKTLLLPSAPTAALHPLIELFDKVRDQELQRLAQADKDPLRRQLDHAVAALLGVDPAKTDRWRELLAAEPTISNKPAV